MQANLSILGLYNYNPDVLSGLIVPADLERQTLIDYIMMECADLEVLYPNLDLLQTLIASWATARQHSWERLYQSTIQKYNMIHNFDRYEEWEDSGHRNRSGQHNETANSQGFDSSNSESNGNGSSNNTTNQTTQKPGFNVADGLVATESVNNTVNGTTRETSRSLVTGNTNSSTNRGVTENENEGTTGRHTGHLYGNIGVTTAAQMLTQERELYKWDVYAAIAQEFKERFCVLVY